MYASTQTRQLSFAVRPAVVGKYAGQLCVPLAVLTSVAAAVAFLDGDYHFAGWCALGALGVGLPGHGLSRLRATARLQSNECLVVSGLVFMVAAASMVPAFMSCGLRFEDAVFEAVSGVTTTGLTTVAAVEDLPRSAQFARSWMQWYGGLGFVVLTLAFIFTPSMAARRLSNSESDIDAFSGSARIYSRHVFLIYTAMTGLAFVAALAAGAPWFDALTHTLSALSTGGFSNHANSLAALPRAATMAILAFSFAGALPLGIFGQLPRGRGPGALALSQFLVLAGAAFAVSLCLALTLLWQGQMPWPAALGHGAALVS